MKIYLTSLISILLALPTQYLVGNYIIRLFAESLTALATYITLLVFTNSFSWRDYELLKKTFKTIPLFGGILMIFLEAGRFLLQIRDKHLHKSR
jgi:hypothetical protein